MTNPEEAIEILTVLHERPMTCRELTAHLYGQCDGRRLWAVAGMVDRLERAGLIVKCNMRDGTPVYAA